MARYRSKPTEVEAIQWTGDNFADVDDFTFTIDGGIVALDVEAVVGDDGRITEGEPTGKLWLYAGKDGAQGDVEVPAGHWIVRQPGDMTDHWPVDPDYFAAKYEPADG